MALRDIYIKLYFSKIFFIIVILQFREDLYLLTGRGTDNLVQISMLLGTNENNLHSTLTPSISWHGLTTWELCWANAQTEVP